MSKAGWLAINFYRLLTRLYPSSFREEFGAEMLAVFTEAVTEVAQTKPYTLLIVCWREVRDYPSSVLREHRRELAHLEPSLMSTIKKKVLYLFALVILAIVCWLFVSLLWGSKGPGWLIVTLIACWLFASALAWAARRISHSAWIYAGLLILAGLVLPTSMLVEVFPDRLSSPFGSSMAITLFLIPSMALVIAAMLLHSGLNLYGVWQRAGAVEGGGSQVNLRHAGRAATAGLVLSALLLVKSLHNIYWLTLWDNTTDPLGYFWLGFPVIAALFSGILLSTTLPDKAKLVGFFYALLIPALMIGVSARAQRVDFRQLTDKRAERVSRAIESYYAREGHYPQDLRQLIPWYTLALPGPVIIHGQEWCYDGGEAYYRLGYVYREHWSDPRLTGRIYKTKGDVPDLHPMCEDEVATLQRRYPDLAFSYWTGSE